jgi:hypothetical protein
MTLITMLLLSQIQVNIPLPTISFPAPPPLVVVQPGIQVVEDNDDEIFFTDGFYWHRRDGHWFRTKEHNGKWVVVEERVVPAPLVRMTPGQYRRYRKQEQREAKREAKEERREEKHHGNGKHKK